VGENLDGVQGIGYCAGRSIFRGMRWLRLPLVRPLHQLSLFIAIPFLDFADNSDVVPSNLLQVIVRTLAHRSFSSSLNDIYLSVS
jgi:hypothetical protein